jgi:hypothetical protein
VLKIVDGYELAGEVGDAEREVLPDTDVLPGPPEPPSVQMYVRCLTRTGETLKHCTSLEKVVFFLINGHKKSGLMVPDGTTVPCQSL